MFKVRSESFEKNIKEKGKIKKGWLEVESLSLAQKTVCDTKWRSLLQI